MAKADPFLPAMRDVAANVSEWLAASELPTSDITINSPLLVWDIGSGASLADAATSSSEWHHQILQAGRPIAFARSRLIDKRAELIELAESPLTTALEEAYRMLRAAPSDSIILRLLRIQRNHTTCLWLYKAEGGDEVITLQSPVWKPMLRVDESTFLRMVRMLPGPGLVASRSDQRRESADPWSRQHWPSSRSRPVRQNSSEL